MMENMIGQIELTEAEQDLAKKIVFDHEKYIQLFTTALHNWREPSPHTTHIKSRSRFAPIRSKPSSTPAWTPSSSTTSPPKSSAPTSSR
jgi:hypothetical protein